MPVRRLLYALLGMAAFAALVLALWAPFLSHLVPNLDVNALGGARRVRVLGAGAFLVLAVLQFLVRPPRAPSRQAILWGEFARSSGGTVSEEPRGLGSMGWTGGTTVRWDARGVPVTLSSARDTDRNSTTSVQADVVLKQPFQLHVAPETMLARALFSSVVWNLALHGVKEREAAEGSASPSLATRLAFLADKEILVGDPAIDHAYLIKTDTPDRAREFVTDAGVSCALHELNAIEKGWQLGLMEREPGKGHRLTLTTMGLVLDARELEAIRALFEACVRCLLDRGMLASSGRAA